MNGVTTQLFIDGEARDAASGDYYPLHNPARPDELVGYAAAATATDVASACAAAHKAFPGWATLSYADRADYLIRIADALEGDEADLRFRSELFCREHGKILRETTLEMTRLGDRFRSVASYAERLAEDEKLHTPPFDTIITRQPRGVAALIVPWNWPLSILGAKLPQALLAGNTVVVKPSRSAAMAPALTIAKIAALLPPGVVNLLTGLASAIGDPLLSDPHVRFINFTGSVEIGQHVMRIAAENLTPLTLELGGNDAGLILDDVALDAEAFQRLYMAAFSSTGQICMALKRLYVHRSRYDEIVEGLRAACNRAVVGDGLDPETTMGPLNNRKQLETVRAMLDQARAANADVEELGQVPDEALYNQGYFQRPALVYRPDHALDIVCEEQFGPALPIMVFDRDQEAVALANDSRFGLCSSVWTADRDRAVALARKLEAGYTYLNGHGPMAQDNRAPFGGFKNSGIGRNLGFEGVIAFQGSHSISAPPGWLFG